MGLDDNAKGPIFVAHPSGHLTDHVANGDGLVAHGFLSGLAERGYELHVAADEVSLSRPLPANVTIYPLQVRSSNRTLRLLEYAVRMRLLYERLRREHRFKIALQMNPVFPGISLALLGSGVPLILGTYVPRWSTGFGDAYDGVAGWAAKLRDGAIALQQAQADALLLTTPAAANRLPVLKLDSPKVFYVPHGVDTVAFRPEEDERIAGRRDGRSILFAASVSQRKGIFDLIEAFPQILAAVPGARLTIAGTGDDFEQVRQRVERLGCQKEITFLGRIPREELAKLYRQHDLYCLPSYGEPFATTLLEAMASGMPVVSTNTGGTPFLITEGGGRLVDPGDVVGLARAISSILSSRQLQLSMGCENRRLALEKYAWSKVIDRLEGIYFEVSGGRIGRPAQSRLAAQELAYK
jgi:glycosyltransferase involved in cell wall biosynthesis